MHEDFNQVAPPKHTPRPENFVTEICIFNIQLDLF